MPKVEYLTAIFVRSGQDYEPGPGEPGLRQTWVIVGPDLDSGERDAGMALTSLLNELGQLGWRLVTCDILESAMAYRRNGYAELSVPAVQRWIFSREVVGT